MRTVGGATSKRYAHPTAQRWEKVRFTRELGAYVGLAEGSPSEDGPT